MGILYNKDTWVPNADMAYFHIGEQIGYISSECWTSSFLGHDDNFGPNFRIPRLYIEQDNVEYVVELFRSGIQYSGVQAEALALNFFYSIIPQIPYESNTWLSRLCKWAEVQQIILRAQSVNRTEYVEHLRTLRDWENNTEFGEMCQILQEEIPPMLWIVEISIPQLFATNERKL